MPLDYQQPLLAVAILSTSRLTTTTDNSKYIYPTRTVHNNDCQDSENIGDKCLAERHPGEPSDPQFPKWWISDWTMYRVFNQYDQFPPPYTSPPEGLKPSDYEVSYGKTYYDSTYGTLNLRQGTGAMMEYYEDRCLPIFHLDNKYTCAIVSLGNKAYFLNYKSKQSDGNPSICLFSQQNHPPRTDFIKHLPYNAKDSTHVNNSLQAYSILVPKDAPNILFGYAFYQKPSINSFDQTAIPYRHPQSFYFSGDPRNPPNAPIISQNYSNFHMEKPNPEIWSTVAELVKRTPNMQKCCLFDNQCSPTNK